MTEHEPKLQIRSRVPIDDEDRARLVRGLEPLRRIVADFPQAELHLDVRDHHRVKDFHVRLELRLPRRTIFTGERGVQLYGAYERCVRKLVHKVEAYKEKLRGVPERRKVQAGTSHEVYPLVEPDGDALERAVAAGDFASFRRELDVYGSSLASRVSRLANRYPELVDRLGSEIAIEEIVDEVCLQAFDHFADRSEDRLGNWLERWIGPSIEALVDHPEDEKRNLTLLEDAAEVPSSVRRCRGARRRLSSWSGAQRGVPGVRGVRRCAGASDRGRARRSPLGPSCARLHTKPPSRTPRSTLHARSSPSSMIRIGIGGLPRPTDRGKVPRASAPPRRPRRYPRMGSVVVIVIGFITIVVTVLALDDLAIRRDVDFLPNALGEPAGTVTTTPCSVSISAEASPASITAAGRAERAISTSLCFAAEEDGTGVAGALDAVSSDPTGPGSRWEAGDR